MIWKKQIAFLLFLVSVHFSFGQNTGSTGTKLIDSYLKKQEITKADSVLQQQIIRLKSGQQIDSLIDYIYYLGKIEMKLSNAGQAVRTVTQFADEIKSATSEAHSLRQLYLELGSFYELAGNPQKAYESNLIALEYTSKMQGVTGEDFGLVHSNLGALSQRTGNLHQALLHHKKALKYYKSYPETDNVRLYITYNSLGGMMWFAAKIDSALYFYRMADFTLKELPQTPLNKYYRPAMLNNNIAAIYSSQGNTRKALVVMSRVIGYWEAFFRSDAPDFKKESGKNAYFQAVENYAGIFKNLGDFQKARDLLLFAWREKQKYYTAGNPAMFKSKILLGQTYLSLKDYKTAGNFLESGIEQIANTPGAFYFWNADAHYSMGQLNEELGNNQQAAGYYEKAESLYQHALQGAYDEIYLGFIIGASYFYAKNGNAEKALEMSQKAYNYIVKNQGKKTMFEFQQLLNLGEIYYVLGDYPGALEKSKTALELLKNRMYTKNTALDSTFVVFEKPQAVLLKVKSEYALQQTKDTLFLIEALKEIQDAISILERRKSFIGEGNNLSILISDNNSLFEFAKTLALELFQQTAEEKYLGIIFTMHESSLYNRIRSRLGTRTSISYKNLPDNILTEEKSIKEELGNVLDAQNSMEAFFDANAKWKDFLNKLKRDYPDYYDLKYASITETDIWPDIQENTAIVRYIFIADDLYALVIGADTKQMLKLNQTGLAGQIAKTSSDTLSFKEISDVLYQLYNALWKPVESHIKTNHIIIIPDRELFNLSFETLTPKPIRNFADLANNSLLARYSVSYNYSLPLVNHKDGTTEFDENFIAFVPEFSDKMKQDYRISVMDSLELDKTYLTLLPQPFSLNLAKTSVKLFDGKSFLNERSTKQIFMNSAKEHKIIHIGTHAESNNLSPELSRLVFAKPLNETGNKEDNSLFVYEIYNCDLSSSLAILTACETGKPTWQPGEGMISLAHAFNYAGSQSILTSLWKIDEKSSSKIVKLFYDQLAAGLSKDKALQKAKLEYLGTENGRALSPKYWAGLILIGNSSPVPVSTSGYRLIWLFGLLFLLGLVSYLILKKLL